MAGLMFITPLATTIPPHRPAKQESPESRRQGLDRILAGSGGYRLQDKVSSQEWVGVLEGRVT